MGWALLIGSNPLLQQLIGGAVTAELGTKCEQAANLELAEGFIREHGLRDCRVIVCSITAPINGEEPPVLDGSQLNGLDFVRGLRSPGSIDPPVIFIAAFTDTERKIELAPISNSTIVGVKHLWRDLPLAIGSLVLKKKTKAAKVDLDIVLHAGGPYTWCIRGNQVEDTGVFAIRTYDIERLIKMSMAARRNDGEFLQILGEYLYMDLMRDPMKNDRLESKLQAVGGLPSVCIRFGVDEKTQRILLETLADPGDVGREPQFWMLRAPMFRKLGTTGKGAALFQGEHGNEQPVNCLLIEAMTDRFSLDEPVRGTFESIKHATSEIALLKKRLEAQPASAGVGQVKVLRRRDHPLDFASVVQAEMRAHDYHLVHYAGHSALGSENQAYLVLGDAKGECIPIKDFAEYCETLRFVFLSSCDSANSQFILQLVRCAPAVVGYAWPVADDMALEFAQAFYEKLFGRGRERHMLEYSFMAAKQALHGRAPTLSHWAAPMLFMQVLEHSAPKEVKV